MKTSLITGITGQDGSYLAELLLDKGYTVHGIVMEEEMNNPQQSFTRIQTILDRITLHQADLHIPSQVNKVFNLVKPDECYHLAAQSFVSYALQDESSTITTNVNGTYSILAALKKYVPKCKFYFAGSSEMFGNVHSSPQDENTPFNPRSIYGVTKVAGYFLTKYYRQNHGIFTCSGIAFNHESERRGFEFVTRKITCGVAKIKAGKASNIRLGNIEARRDWGYAPEYTKAMWLMLQQDNPDDYVIGTGVTHSVKDFLEIAFGVFDLDWQKYVIIDKGYYRPVEEIELKANPGKARENLHWHYEIGFETLVKKMVLTDYEIIQNYQQNKP
jgi:GDPmannose 4,6-dehydratase